MPALAMPFSIFVLNPASWPDAAMAAAAARAGGTGFLDLENCRVPERALASFRQLLDATHGRIGLRLTAAEFSLAEQLRVLAGERDLSWLVSGDPSTFSKLVRPGDQMWAEVADDTLDLAPHRLAGLVIKGSESALWCGEDSSFILAQKWLARTDLPVPVLVRGGVGLHSAAALAAVGAAGVVLDDQVLLLDESPLSAVQKTELARLNGAETRLLGEAFGQSCRVYARPSHVSLKAIEATTRATEAGEQASAQWRQELLALIGWNADELLPVGQGIGVAAGYRDQYGRLAKLMRALRRAAGNRGQEAVQQAALAAEGPLAQSHGTRYPVVQGPMTRVSDHAGFAHEVAAAGALPMLALALMRGEQVLGLLQETQAKMQGMPWGVGLLGFVPQTLRDEQCAAIWQCPPSFALIAGGRPDQAQEFERRGIATYIHAPAPELLNLYLEQGSTRFVFEGRECGGHIGPIASFPLWEQVTELLLRKVKPGTESSIHLLFAGGIGDARSAALLAALTAPLTERGMKVGVLMGTAYLFTQEIVSSGAVVPGFQEEALACRRTACLETGPGHATRCAVTDFALEFAQRRRDLLASSLAAEEIRDQLEELNLGRLRLASKGLERTPAGVERVSGERQRAEGMYMIGQVATLADRVQSIAELHHKVCAESQKLLTVKAQAASQRTAPLRPSDIAIVGIGLLVPKASDRDAFWENILHQVNVTGEVPRERWDWRLYFDADRNARDKIYSKWGGFIDELPFDPTRYGIPPRSMKSIDPMQLLSLEAAQRALADAGYADGDFDREHTAVILGSGGGVGDLGMQYGVRSELPRFVESPDERVWDRLPEWTNESFAGVLQNVAAGRIANRLDLGGANFTVDAACASSLAAVALAVSELESGRANVALAGGIDTVQGPFGYMCFSKTQALSPTGKAKTFDQGADGIVISEGAAVLVLKRLADAERDGDRIYSVIKAVAGSSDGKALGMTAPRPDGQIRALDRAYAKAGFSLNTVELIEAHGTGTPVGDRAEAETITRALRSHGAPAQGAAIGSIKTVLGHTKCAAGIVGMTKVVLSLHHRVLPAHAGVERPLEMLAAADSPAYLLKAPRPWLRRTDGLARRGAASAFGFGGTNFHAVLEEYQGERAASGARHWPWELILLCAADRQALLAKIEQLTVSLGPQSCVELASLAHALAREAEQSTHMPAVAAFAVRDLAGLRQDLQVLVDHLRNGKALAPHIKLNLQRPSRAPRTAFLFPGQGAQYVNMGCEAALYLEPLRAAMELAEASLAREFQQPLSRLVWPSAAFSVEAESAQAAELTDTRVAQPAIGTLSLGYLGLTQTLGLTPDAVGGHSYGEYTALHAAGVLDAAALLRLSAVRGCAMAQAAREGTPGTMAAVQASRAEVEKQLEKHRDVCLANHNAPGQTVISGPLDAVQRAIEAFTAAGLRVARLPVSGAFHTPLVAAAQKPLSAALYAETFRAPQVPVYSNTTGRRHPMQPEEIRQQLDQHLLSPVEFVSELESMYDDGIRLFVEVGPKSICSNLVTATLGARADVRAVALDGQGGGLRGLMMALAELATTGVRLAWTRLFDGRDLGSLDLQALEALSRPEPLPKTTWMLCGGYARPMDEPLRSNGKQPALTVEQRQRAPQQSVAAAAPRVPLAPSATQLEQLVPFTAGGNGLSAEVLVAYQDTMRQFLALQEQVMTQFLAATPGIASATTASLSVPLMTVSAVQPVIAPAIPAVMPEKTSPTPAPQALPDRGQLESQLLALVAERTGYPPEMLNIHADLEADLGIDSIKRVEIVGAFQKSLPAAIAQRMQAGMERYTRAKTLQAMLDAVQLPINELPQPDAMVTVAPAASVSVVINFEELLLGIVAERTGYPRDMLSLTADLEADLGIDSIKRVEIVGAFQKQLPGEMAQAMQAQLERYTRAKSLQRILEQLPTAPVVQPVPAAATKPTVVSPQALLLVIVAERTGYPQDMLSLTADLEADLGIDSIKRVEIVGAFQKQLPVATAQQMQAQLERYTRAKTLRALLDALPAAQTAAEVMPAVSVSVPDIKPSPTGDALALPRYLVRPRQIAALALPQKLEGTVVVLGGPEDIATALVQRLQALGARAVCVTADSLDEIASLPAGALIGAIHLDGLIAVAGEHVEAIYETGNTAVLGLFRLAQALAPRLGADFRLLAATRQGGTFNRDARSVGSALAGGVVGLLNCLRAEYPGSYFLPVDFNGQTAQTIADHLVAEFAARQPLPEVGYTGDARYTCATVEQALQDNPFALQLEPRPDWVVMATGGARGITAEILEEMVRPGMRLVLLGRSPEPGPEEPALAAASDAATLRSAFLARAQATGETVKPADINTRVARVLADREIRSALTRLRAAGAQTEYLACDVRNAEDFSAVIEGVYSRHGRIDAVLHGAGVIEDKLLADKQEASFHRVWSTKVDPAMVLLNKLRPEALSLFVLFTSVAGRYGNRGQSDYAAANEALARLAWQLSRSWTNTRVMAVHWGPWDAGMASAEVKAQFRRRGITPIPVTAGRRYFLDELARGSRQDVELVIGEGPWQELEQKAQASTGAGLVPQLPLVREPLRMAAGGALSALQSLSIQHDPYLEDHCLEGRPVLPAAGAAEYLAQMAAAGWAGWQVAELRDLRVLSGISLERLDASRDLEFRLRASSHSTPQEQSLTAEILDPQRRGAACYRAGVRLVQRLPEPPLAAVVPLSGRLRAAEDSYREYLFHGPRFRLLRGSLQLTDQGVDAEILPTTPQAWIGREGHWLFDPGLLDGAPQLAIIWARVHQNLTALPSAFGLIRRYGHEPLQGPLRLHLRLRSSPQDSNLVYDAWYVDAQGRVRLEIERAEATGSSALNRLAAS